jgi:hypothetical protein
VFDIWMLNYQQRLKSLWSWQHLVLSWSISLFWIIWMIIQDFFEHIWKTKVPPEIQMCARNNYDKYDILWCSLYDNVVKNITFFTKTSWFCDSLMYFTKSSQNEHHIISHLSWKITYLKGTDKEVKNVVFVINMIKMNQYKKIHFISLSKGSLVDYDFQYNSTKYYESFWELACRGS